jgi:RimJ/RimL family protein N-acetyltransferase
MTVLMEGIVFGESPRWHETQPEVDEVWAATDEDHTASQGVLVRSGFELVDRNDGMRRYRRSADVAE